MTLKNIYFKKNFVLFISIILNFKRKSLMFSFKITIWPPLALRRPQRPHHSPLLGYTPGHSEITCAINLYISILIQLFVLPTHLTLSVWYTMHSPSKSLALRPYKLISNSTGWIFRMSHLASNRVRRTA
jgi:hypothetical protein